MHEPSRRKLLTMAGLASVASVASVANAAGIAGGLLAAPTPDAGAAPPTPRERIRERYFPNVLLRTQDDKPVRFYDDLIKNRAVTINFFYANCDEVCPLVTANLAKVQKLLGDRVGRDIFMYSVSLRPEQDTPAALKRYGQMHGAQPGWTFLTGDRADVELLRQSLGFTNPSAKVDKDITQHIGNVRYGNEPLMLWAACPGQARAEWIVESISWVIRPEDTQAAISRG
ncbi:MAG TPA: SCO family protein [Thermoanaerobaculia bacterium]|jgi:protein SCO1/2|nr:SCO family protein [Thermoanaerobaculia bacterium]